MQDSIHAKSLQPLSHSCDVLTLRLASQDLINKRTCMILDVGLAFDYKNEV